MAFMAGAQGFGTIAVPEPGPKSALNTDEYGRVTRQSGVVHPQADMNAASGGQDNGSGLESDVSGGPPGMRKGGPVRAGYPYRVAEDGPEAYLPQHGQPQMLPHEQTMVPPQDGQIISNDALRAMVRARLNSAPGPQMGAPQASQGMPPQMMPQGAPAGPPPMTPQQQAAMRMRLASMRRGGR